MKHRSPTRRWVALASGLALLATAACDQSPLDPTINQDATLDGASTVAILQCVGRTASPVVTCAQPNQASGPNLNLSPSGPSRLIVGNQGVYVTLTSSNAAYDAGSQAFTFDVTVTNHLPQPLGTEDGTTLDANGVRVFFHQGPSATGGSGSIAVVPDGTGTFTGSNQPYYQYDEVLPTGATSAGRIWTLTIPPTVETFAFLLYVVAEVPYPNGFLDVGADSLTIEAGDTLHLDPVFRTATGREIDGDDPVVVESSDSSVVSVDGDGILLGVAPGQVVITLTAGEFLGRVVVTVAGTEQLWVGSISSDWSDPENWSRSQVPTSTDSVRIPVVAGGASYPVLTEPVTVAQLTVDADATLSLGGFDLTTAGSVVTGQTGGIEGSGTLHLTGTDQSIAGVLPRTRITGTYALSGNTSVSAPIAVAGGLLRNRGYTLRAH